MSLCVKKTIFFSFILFGILGIAISAHLAKAQPHLSTMTCRNYWNYHQEAVDIHKPNKEERLIEYNKNLQDLWDYEFTIFKNEHPDLVDLNLQNIGEDARFIGMVYHACEMREENMDKRVGDRLQKVLFHKQKLSSQERTAKQNGCDIHEVSTNKNITSERASQYLCINNNWSKSYSKTDEDTSETVRCFVYRDRENCFPIITGGENECLGFYGSCNQDRAGKCSWISTDESQACIRKKNK